MKLWSRFCRVLAIGLVIPGKILRNLVARLLKPCFRSAGTKVRFSPFDRFDFHEIDIGDDVFIASGAWFAGRKIRIGSHVMFGPRVMIQAGAHQFRGTDGWMSGQPEVDREKVKGVIIEDNVWIAANVTLIDGAFVGEGSVIGAGSLVSGVIPPNSIAVGVPARVIRPRLDELGLEEYSLPIKVGWEGISVQLPLPPIRRP